jgi:hypothetical protein
MILLATFLKKSIMIALILSLGLAALPFANAHAAGSDDPATPPAAQSANQRLENLWSREQQVYQRAGELLTKAGNLIPKAQALVDKANAKVWDTTVVQAALNAFQSALQNAQAAYAPGAEIIADHTGFDTDSKVVDRQQAIATVKALRQVLKDTRGAMAGTSKALMQAFKDLRNAHKPTATPVPATP